MTQSAASSAPVHPATSQVLPTPGSLHRLAPLPISEVTLTGGFWGQRQQVNLTGIIPHALEWEKRIGWIDNFVRAAAGTIAGHHAGLWFADSDVYKLIEAMAWEIGRLEARGTTEDLAAAADLEAEIQRLGALIEAVQDEDGYLNTRYGKPGTEERYTNFPMGHELYCTGHLVQAAVARLRTGRTRQDVIVRVALRNADHVCATFGPDGTVAVGGHPEVEVALAELYRATGERRYLDQAQLFLDRRGHGLLGDIQWGREYFQDATPIREETVARGHAVRALYLMAGAIDAAMERGDAELLDIVRAQYERTLARRTYVTGGMGSRHEGEAFGDDFELPADRSYCETCAGIASIMVAWRLLLATGETSYADVIERTLYNVVATSPAADGRSFFYANPLQVRVPGEEAITGELSTRSGSSLRASWFEVSCCPTNIARTLASLAGSALTRTAAGDGPLPGVQIHLLAPMTVRTTVPTPDGDAPLVLELATTYPAAGRVTVRVRQAPQTPVSVAVRVPAWARAGATLDGRLVAGSPAEGTGPGQGGYAVVTGVLHAGEEHVLDLPLAPRLTAADPRVDGARGCLAVERGPLVMCLESAALPAGLSTEEVALAAGSVPWEDDAGATWVRLRRLPAASGTSAYRQVGSAEVGVPGLGEELQARLTPYHAWGNRGPVTMRVWLPVA